MTNLADQATAYVPATFSATLFSQRDMDYDQTKQPHILC